MNPSMEGMVKIGKTQREPEIRAKELSSTTGVPTPFVVVYESYFVSCSEAEDFVHTSLGAKGYRVSENREFFEIPIKVAIDVLMEASNHFGKCSKEGNNSSPIVDSEIISENNSDSFFDNLELGSYVEPRIEPWAEMLELAEGYYYGQDGEIQDYEEAMIYFMKAIKLGSLEAYVYVGDMYYFGEGVVQNYKKALQFFKEGMKKGHMKCYGKMAGVFAYEGHMDNASKCWAKFFEQDSSSLDFSQAHNYMAYFIYENGFKLEYVDKLNSIVDEILSCENTLINIFKRDLKDEKNLRARKELLEKIAYVEGRVQFISDALI